MGDGEHQGVGCNGHFGVPEDLDDDGIDGSEGVDWKPVDQAYQEEHDHVHESKSDAAYLQGSSLCILSLCSSF